MRKTRRLITVGIAWGLILGAALHAEWPLSWDNDGRGDVPLVTHLGADGDVYVLVESHLQAAASPHTVLLRIDSTGAIVWQGSDFSLTSPRGLALRPDGGALVTGSGAGGLVIVTSFGADGVMEWSRNRADVSWESEIFGEPAQPTWSEEEDVWWIPLRKNGGFLVAGYDTDGVALPDWTWEPPNGDGGATSVRPRPEGGLIVAGISDGGIDPPGWWVVATDALGDEIWSHFDIGDAPAGVFSGAVLLATDDDRLIATATDESAFGVFALRIWSLDPTHGSELWATTWPSPGSTSSFTPNQTLVSGNRVVSVGLSDAIDASNQTVALSFDVHSGLSLWERGFAGPTVPIRTRVSSAGGSALVASSHFPSPNPGPVPLWVTPWEPSGDSCSTPMELLPTRVAGSLRSEDGQWYVVGSSFGDTGDDVLIQRLQDPCSTLFSDGFETGDLIHWGVGLP